MEAVGRAMAHDAITSHQQSGGEGAAAVNVMAADNNAIRRLAETQTEPSGSSVPSAGSEASSSP